MIAGVGRVDGDQRDLGEVFALGGRGLALARLFQRGFGKLGRDAMGVQRDQAGRARVADLADHLLHDGELGPMSARGFRHHLHQVAILGLAHILAFDQEVILVAAIDAFDPSAMAGRREQADHRLVLALVDQLDDARLEALRSLTHLAERQVTDTRIALADLVAPALGPVRRAGIDQVGPEQAVIAARLADQVAMLIDAQELHQRGVGKVVFLDEFALAGALNGAAALELFQHGAKLGALVALYIETLGDVAAGRDMRIGLQKGHNRLLVWKTHGRSYSAALSRFRPVSQAATEQTLFRPSFLAW